MGCSVRNAGPRRRFSDRGTRTIRGITRTDLELPCGRFGRSHPADSRGYRRPCARPQAGSLHASSDRRPFRPTPHEDGAPLRLKRFLLLIVLAIPVSARVISYAPYSNRVSRSAHHERTTRWFLLSEESTGYEVVLYDSAGVHEPRVVASGSWQAPPTALYERKKAPDPPPILLVGRKLSIDGGLTWKTLNDPYFDWSFEPWDFDTGGPFVHGLATGILPGTDAIPFVVGGDGHSEIYAVHANGNVTVLYEHAGLVGRNATGDKFLINDHGEIFTVDLAGRTTFVTDLGWGGYS